jgi:serine kinase of HPr protein (carbohydrate metabolism regulator)
MTLHATAVQIDGRAVLLLGRSGSGKSDLALRLIDRGARLIADDRVIVDGGIAACPPTTQGKLEVRGIGIVTMPAAPPAPIALAVDLDTAPERLPEPATRDIGGRPVPVIALRPFDPSTTVKIELALRTFGVPLERPPR